jgi:hypothetical protein
VKTCIIIHVLPFEIDRFEHQMFELKKNFVYLDEDDIVNFDVTLNVNNLLTDWENSQLPQRYFIDRYYKIVLGLFNKERMGFNVSANNECLGVDDKRRQAIRNHASTCDNFIYLDNDMFYPNTTLKYMLDAARIIKNKYYIISPQLPKMWEPSWDVLVNEAYINNTYEDSTCEKYTTDQFEVFNGNYGDIELTPINTFKMGGGWFNMISSNLLAYTDIPDSFGPYGLDDTFVIDACKIMKNMGIDVQQYILKNLVVTQSYQYELHHVYNDYLKFNIKQKQIFAAEAQKSYPQEII